MHICVYIVYVISDSKSFENFKQNQPKEIHTKVSIMDLVRGEKIMNTARNGGKKRTTYRRKQVENDNRFMIRNNGG